MKERIVGKRFQVPTKEVPAGRQVPAIRHERGRAMPSFFIFATDALSSACRERRPDRSIGNLRAAIRTTGASWRTRRKPRAFCQPFCTANQ
jgi:hypothetical protein